MGLLRRLDGLVKAGFRMRNRLEDPDYYRGGSPTLLLVIVGLAAFGILIYAGFMAAARGPLLSIVGGFPQVAGRLPLRLWGQLVVSAIALAAFSILADIGRLIVIGGLKSLKQGK